MSKRKDQPDTLAEHSHFWIADELHVQPDRLVVMRGNEEIRLEKRMMEVLVLLAENANKTVSKEELLIAVWGNTIYGDNPVNKTISLLRDRIGDVARAPRYIETVVKIGFRMIATVSLPADYRRTPSDRWTSGSPYVGLKAYDIQHKDVFCGRTQTVADLLRAMRNQIDNQRRFVMVVGASGCGKTSLLRAGAIPLLTKPDGFDGLHAMSLATCDLATVPVGDPLTALAESLASWEMSLPGTSETWPVFPPMTSAHLGSLLAEDPARIGRHVAEAFRRHADAELSNQPHAHLLLIVDHAEALVGAADRDPDAIAGLSRVLEGLCASTGVLVVMVTRADFYSKLMETMPTLADYKSGDGHLDIMPPRRGDISEMIREPAWQADLTFEIDEVSRERLDDVLRDAATSQPDALPLLQHTLSILYENKKENRLLTFAAYRAVGGLEGAIAHRAEEVFATLPDAQRSSLDTVLSRLIVLQPDSDAVSARRNFTDDLDQEARALVDAFIAARLFVSDQVDGRPVFGVAHEALLRRWPRAVEWCNENRRLLHAKFRLQSATRRWVEEGRRDDHLLNPGRPLGEARETAQRFSGDLSPDDRALLKASERMFRRRRMIRHAAVATLAVLAAVSTALAALATQASRTSEQHRKEAVALIGYMLVELADQLRPTASTQSLDSISTYALNLLERQSIENMTADDLINYSRALRTRGEVLSMQGKDDRALSLFKRADAMTARARQLGDNYAPAVLESGQTAYWIGFEYRKREDIDQAMTHWQQYLRRSEHLLALDGVDPNWRMEPLLASTNLGTLELRAHGCDVALDRLVSSLSRMHSMIANGNPKSQWTYHWIVTRSWVSRCHAENGMVSLASTEFISEISDLRTLLVSNPGAIEWNHQLSSLLHFGTMQSINRDQLDAAEMQISEAIELLRMVTRLQPENVTWRRNLVSALARGSEVAYLRGDFTTARSRLNAARIVVDRQRPSGLGNAWKRLDATIRFRTGLLQQSRDGEVVMSSAIDDLHALAKANPEDDYTLAALSNALVARGLRLEDSGRTDDARQTWARAKSVLDAIAVRSRDPDLLTPWIKACLLLGQPTTAQSRLHDLLASGYRHPEVEALRRRSVD
jgi:DNA-binding winged helix-turn-helix (wHTH) protein/tetratricopeptide (TPR) repeat protein